MINRYSDVPLYVQLKNIIIQKIDSGEYRQDEQIPSEQELCEQFFISRPTVRQAINELTTAGFLRKEKGRGTFVSLRTCLVEVENYSGFTYSILESQIPGELDILGIKTVGKEAISPFLRVFDINDASIDEDSKFAEITHVIRKKERVVCYNTSIIPLHLFPDIEKSIREMKPSYEILKNRYPYVPVSSKSKMEIDYTSKIDSNILCVQLGQPILKVQSILTGRSGQTVEYIQSKFRTDLCRLSFENRKHI